MMKSWWELAKAAESNEELDGTTVTDEMVAKALDAEATRIEESPGEQTRRDNMILDLELYYGCPMPSLHDISLGAFDVGKRLFGEAETPIYMVIYGMTQAVLNWVCSFKPRAEFVPSSGDHKLFRGAKDMRQACDAWMQEKRFYESRNFMFRDIITGPGGVVKVYVDGKGLDVSRFPAWEILVDESDGRYMRPEVMMHAPWMPLDQAIAKYGDGTDATEQAIRKGARQDVPGITYSHGRSLVRVVDAYRQKWEDSEGTEHDGRHVIMIGGCLKLNEAWKWEGHPFVVKRFDFGELGYWGVSGIHSVRGVQIAANDETESMETSHQMSSQQVIIQQEDDAPLQNSNAVVRIYKYKNVKPDVINPPAVGMERYKWLETLRDIAYEIWGVPRNLAQGMAQRNLESGEALRESVEVKSDRISNLTSMNEEIVVEVADWWRKLSSELPASEWQVMDRGLMKTIKSPNLGKNVAVRVIPTSLFGASKSAQIDKAFEFVDRGILTQEDAFRAVDVPDLEPITNLKMAEANLREMIVDDILQDDKYVPPPEYMDPTAMHEYAKRRYFAALVSGVKFPMENMASLCKLIDAEAARAKAIAEKAPAAQVTIPAPPPGMAPPAAPPGAPPPAGSPMDPALMPPPPMPAAPGLPPPGTGGPAPLQ